MKALPFPLHRQTITAHKPPKHQQANEEKIPVSTLALLDCSEPIKCHSMSSGS